LLHPTPYTTQPPVTAAQFPEQVKTALVFKTDENISMWEDKKGKFE